MTDKKLVHIVDDEEAIRKSASFMLESAGYAVEIWASGAAFLEGLEQAERGCVLLDVRMPGIDGLEVQQALGVRVATMPVIVLTGHGDVSIAVRAMKAGAVDFIEKPFKKSVLLAAIEAGFVQMDAATAQSGQADAALKIAKLTPRERDVLHALANGLPNKAIAHDLGISPRTVEIHRANMMAKLQVRGLADALRIAFVAGLPVT